ncbi:VanW family protein [Gracilaria domingensis]|nr:VanW family protein [Gracilaria domingensis]
MTMCTTLGVGDCITITNEEGPAVREREISALASEANDLLLRFLRSRVLLDWLEYDWLRRRERLSRRRRERVGFPEARLGNGVETSDAARTADTCAGCTTDGVSGSGSGSDSDCGFGGTADCAVDGCGSGVSKDGTGCGETGGAGGGAGGDGTEACDDSGVCCDSIIVFCGGMLWAHCEARVRRWIEAQDTTADGAADGAEESARVGSGDAISEKRRSQIPSRKLSSAWS